jgi:hypothetical protein
MRGGAENRSFFLFCAVLFVSAVNAAAMGTEHTLTKYDYEFKNSRVVLAINRELDGLHQAQQRDPEFY